MVSIYIHVDACTLSVRRTVASCTQFLCFTTLFDRYSCKVGKELGLECIIRSSVVFCTSSMTL